MRNHWINLVYWSLNSNFSIPHVLIEKANPHLDSYEEITSFFHLNTELKQSCSLIVDHLFSLHPSVLSLLSDRIDLVEKNPFENDRMEAVEDLIKKWGTPSSPEWETIERLPSNTTKGGSFPCAQVLMNCVEWKEDPIVSAHHERLSLIDDNRLKREKDLSLQWYNFSQRGRERRKRVIEFAKKIKTESKWLERMKRENELFDNTLIVTFTNWGQMIMTEHWILQMKKWGYDNFIVFTFDKKSFDYLEERQINCFFDLTIESVEESQNFGEGQYAWMVNNRLFPLFDLLNDGNDILMIDNDVIILKEMFSMMKISGRDIISQTGSFFPNQAKYCGGFLFFRSTPDTIRLFSDVILVTQNTPEHDQNALNGLGSRAYKKIIKSVLLPERTFPNGRAFFRDQQPQLRKEDPVIVHNNFIISLQSKIHRYREVLLWELDTDSRLFIDSKDPKLSPRFSKLFQAEESNPGSFLVSTLWPRSDQSQAPKEEKETEESIDFGWDEMFDGDDEWNSETEQQNKEIEKKDERRIHFGDHSLSKEELLISKMIIDLGRNPPRTSGRLIHFPWTAFEAHNRKGHRADMIRAFLIAERLNRTLVFPRLFPMELKEQYPNLQWVTMEYHYNISLMEERGLEFREYSYLFNPRVVKNLNLSPLSQTVLIDLLIGEKQPFSDPLSLVFDDPLIKAEFLIPEPIRLKKDRLSIQELKDRFGPDSPFSDVPLLVFSALNVDIDWFDSYSLRMKQSVLLRSLFDKKL